MSRSVTRAKTDSPAVAPAAVNQPRHGLAMVILALVVLLTYMPGNGRFFAADHLFYIAELRGSRALSDGLALVDYSLNRTYWRGDDLLHRPALFAWLAVANTLFHHDFTTWNMATYCLHVLVVLAMYKLLWMLQPSPLAFWLALLFGVSRGSSELVFWNHLGGYLIAFLLIMVALIAAVRLDRGEAGQGYAGAIVCCFSLFLASLFYEIAVPLSVLLAGFFVIRWRSTRRRQLARAAAACLLAAAGYLVVYVVHCLQVPRLLWIDDGAQPGPLGIVVASASAGFNLIADNLVPWTFFDGARHQQRPLRTSIDWPFSRIVQALAVLSGLFLLLWKAVDRRAIRTRLPFATVLVVLLMVYLLLISYGRTSIVLRNGYYAYFVALIGIPLIYGLLDLKRLSKQHVNVIVAILVVAAAVNAVLTYAQGQRYTQASRGADAYFGSLATFIDSKRSEPGFSFSVENGDPELDPQIRLIIGYPSDPAGELTPNLSEVLFLQHHDPIRPKYRLVYGRSGDHGAPGQWFIAEPAEP